MKATVTEGESREITFPLIAKAKHGGFYVLFSEEFEGTQISGIATGESSRAWTSCFDDKAWEIINHPITITFEP